MARHHQPGHRHTRDDHDKDDRHRKPKRKREPKPKKPRKHHGTGGQPGSGDGTAKIKEQASQVITGTGPMAAAPGQMPPDYPDDAAVFGTGPGEAVEYHYHREDLYAQEYANQAGLDQYMTRERAPDLAGPGEIVTSGAANNPT